MRGLGGGSPLGFQGLPGIHDREPGGWGTKWCDPLADRGLLMNNWRGPDGSAQAKGNSMAHLVLSPSVSHQDRHNGSPGGQPHVAGASSARPEVGNLLLFQLRLLVGEILADPGLDPGVHASLFRHLSVHPGRPEVALLAHLREVLDPRELPRC